jgi:hypothetical protein
LQSARQLGRLVAEERMELVYGGGNCGLMGALADEALRHGGRVIGIIPEGLVARDVGHTRLTELHVVKGMHERKALMSKMADAFIAMPGGFGTLEELFEVITWGQLGLHRKPIGLLNVEGYFDTVLQLIERVAGEGFAGAQDLSLLVNSGSPAELMEQLRVHRLSVSGPRRLDRIDVFPET